MGAVKKRIFWVDHDRFDIKPDKSTWLEMAAALTEQGYEVSILTYGTAACVPAVARARVVFVGALDIGWVFRVSLLLNILLWLLRNAGSDDIIIIYPDGLLIAPALRLAGLKNIHLDIRTVPVEVNSIKKRIDRLLFWYLPLRFLRGFAAGYSFITERLRRSVEQEFRVTFPDNVVWQSGVNTDRFRPSENENRSQAGDAFVLFYHGSLTQKRGIDRVIEAIAELDQKHREKMQFVIVGGGPGLSRLKEVASTIGVANKIVFKGPVAYDRVAEEIAKADCCICPLPDRPEWNVSSPLKLFEYMACGKPIIVTRITAHKDVLDGQEFVVWAGDASADEFRDAIEYAYANRVRLCRDAQRGPQLVKEQYDWRIHAHKLGGYFEKTFGVTDSA